MQKYMNYSFECYPYLINERDKLARWEMVDNPKKYDSHIFMHIFCFSPCADGIDIKIMLNLYKETIFNQKFLCLFPAALFQIAVILSNIFV